MNKKGKTQKREADNEKLSKKQAMGESSTAAAESLELECPAELPPVAQEEWRRIVGELIVLGVLSKFDRASLAVYCAAYAAWVEATEAIQQFGMVIKSPNGYPVQSPYVAIQSRNAELLVQIAKEFGFTPASRSRNFSFEKSRSMLLVDHQDEPSCDLKPLTFSRQAEQEGED